MLDIYRYLVALKLDRRGVTALEYAIIAGVLGALLVTGFTKFGKTLNDTLSGVTF